MKCVFALVVLWHLCYSTNSLNMTLNKEMITRLEKLNTLYRRAKVNISSSHLVHVPNQQHPTDSCVVAFITELEHLLANVTVHEDHKNILPELKANVQEFKANLTAPKENCTELKEIPQKSSFRQCANFIRKVNHSLGLRRF